MSVPCFEIGPNLILPIGSGIEEGSERDMSQDTIAFRSGSREGGWPEKKPDILPDV